MDPESLDFERVLTSSRTHMGAEKPRAWAQGSFPRWAGVGTGPNHEAGGLPGPPRGWGQSTCPPQVSQGRECAHSRAFPGRSAHVPPGVSGVLSIISEALPNPTPCCPSARLRRAPESGAQGVSHAPHTSSQKVSSQKQGGLGAPRHECVPAPSTQATGVFTAAPPHALPPALSASGLFQQVPSCKAGAGAHW